MGYLHSHIDESIIRAGDLLVFVLNGLGVLSTPSLREPLPEAEENVTGLRIQPFVEEDSNESGENTIDALHSDLRALDYRRSVFRVELEYGHVSSINFGSVIRLVHVPSELSLVATNVSDPFLANSSNESLNIVLKPEVGIDDELASRWMIVPRYSLREEGDPVRINDHIILRNMQFRSMALGVIANPNTSGGFESYRDGLVGLCPVESCQSSSGLRVVRALSGSIRGKASTSSEQSDSNEGDTLIKDCIAGNDILRIVHQEVKGHLICRVDDNKEIQSVVSPLGSICRKLTTERTFSHAPYVRTIASQLPSEQFDFFSAYSCLGLWQIMLETPMENGNLQDYVRAGSSVRLRHVVSGQYLALRQIVAADCSELKRNAYYFSRKGESKEERIAAMSKFDFINTDADTNTSPHSRFTKTPHPLRTSQLRFRVTTASVTGLRNVEWFGRNSPYLSITFGKRLRVQTTPIERGGAKGEWSIEEMGDDFIFEASEFELYEEKLVITALTKHQVLQDTIIGQGDLRIDSASHVRDEFKFHELHVPLFDRRNRHAGLVTLTICVERLNEVQVNENYIDDDLSDDEGLNDVRDGQLTNDEETTLHRGNNSLRNRWALGTSSLPDSTTLFTIHTLNSSPKSSEKCITYDDNIYFKAVNSGLTFKIGELPPPENVWWEYRSDYSLKPAPLNPNLIIDSDVYKFERVMADEIKDTLFATRLLPLVQAATATLQLTPTPEELYLPLFRHFRNCLHTFVLWTLDKTSCGGFLLPEGTSNVEALGNDVISAAMDLSTFSKSGDEAMDALPSAREIVLRKQYSNDSDSQNDLDFEEGEEDNVHHTTSLSAKITSATKTSHRSSSFAPWLGRLITTISENSVEQTALGTTTIKVTSELSSHSINEVVVRRQTILFDLRIMEHLMHFLNIFFILQRSSSFNESSEQNYSNPIVQQCCDAMHTLLHACVHESEKNALKMLSVHGSFLSLISQKICGWNPPLDTILRIACHPRSSTEENRIDKLSSLDEVLISSITSNDLRQILEQMHSMHSVGNPSAENILSMLSLLCSAGRAAEYFQTALAKLLITVPNEYLEFADNTMPMMTEDDALIVNSMLFSTSFTDDSWKLRFHSKYALPPQEAPNANQHLAQLEIEARGILSLFSTYNNVDIDVETLDLEECFCLLEDLGLGGGWLYEEIGRLIGANLWGFLQWWCRRAPFYYPSTSVSQNQLSPAQTIHLLGLALTDEMLSGEADRTTIDRESIIQSLRFQGIISSRVPGFELVFHHTRSNGVGTRYALRTPIFGMVKHPTASLVFHTRLHRDSKGNSVSRIETPWYDFQQTMSLPEHSSWLIACLSLLSVLCQGSNAFTQRLVSMLLPAEMILAVLQFSNTLSPELSLRLIDILRSVYVEHDMVFATRFVAVNDGDLHASIGGFDSSNNIILSADCGVSLDVSITDRVASVAFCGAYEPAENPAGVAGKVFSPITRVRFDIPGATLSGSKLRKQLFDYIVEEISTANIVLDSKPDQAKAEALLRLLHSLLVKGFFNDASFGFFMVDSDRSSSRSDFKRHFTFSGGSNDSSQEEVFSLTFLESNLLRMLTSIAANHRTNNHALISPPNSSFSSGFQRKSLQHIPDVFSSLDDSHASSLQVSIINSVIRLLMDTHALRQRLRVQQIWSRTVQASNSMASKLYISSTETLQSMESSGSAFVHPLNGGEKDVEALFYERLSEDDVISAVFDAALYSDINHRRDCFALINRRICRRTDCLGVLRRSFLVRDTQSALVLRLLTRYSSVLLRYCGRAVINAYRDRRFLHQQIDFLIDHILAVLRPDFLAAVSVDNAFATGGAAQWPNTTINESDIFLSFEQERLHVIRTELTAPVPSTRREQEVYTQSVIHAASTENESSLLVERFDQPFDESTWRQSHKWSVEAIVVVRPLINQLLEILQPCFDQVLSSENTHDKSNTGLGDPSLIFWEGLLESTRHLFNSLFAFFASLLQGNPNLIDDLVSLALPNAILRRIYPASVGGVTLFHTMIRVGGISFFNQSASVEWIPRRLERLPKATADALRDSFINALLSNNHESVVAVGAEVLYESHLHFLSNSAEVLLTPGVSGFDCLNMEETLLRNSFLSRLARFLRPIHTLVQSRAAMDHGIDHNLMLALRQIYTQPILLRIIQEMNISLALRGVAMEIYHGLYGEHVSIAKYLLDELRTQRVYLAILCRLPMPLHAESVVPPPSTRSVQKFISGTALRHISSCLLASPFVPKITVFDSIHETLEALQYHLINTSIAPITHTYILDEFNSFLRTPPPNQHLDAPLGTPNGERPSLSGIMIGGQSSDESMKAIVCVFISVLNVLFVHDAIVYRKLSMDDQLLLIWITAHIRCAINSQHTCFSSAIFRDEFLNLTSENLNDIEPRITEILRGLLLDRITRVAETSLTSALSDSVFSTLQRAISLPEAFKKHSSNGLLGAVQFLSNDHKARETSQFLQDNLEISLNFSPDFLRTTALYRFLSRAITRGQHFIELGGLLLATDPNAPQIKSKTFSSRFTSYSDYDLWLFGGGRFLATIYDYLGDISKPSSIEFSLIHTLSLLTAHTIEEIRASPLMGLNLKLKLVNAERERLHSTQRALYHFGALRSVVKVLGRSVVTSVDDTFVWEYVPLMLRLGAETMAWQNTELQNGLIDLVVESMTIRKPPELNCLEGLQRLLRRCSSELVSYSSISAGHSTSLTTKGDNSSNNKQCRTLKTCLQLFAFCGALCKGDNNRAQRFIAGEDSIARNPINISTELGNLLHAILTAFVDQLSFLSSPLFYEKIGPFVYAPKDNQKRRFLSWHDPNFNAPLFACYFHTLSVAFDNTIGMCNPDTVRGFFHATPAIPLFLEITGVFQLITSTRSLTSSKSTIQTISNILTSREITWNGGDPFSWYRSYMSEMIATGLLASDPESQVMVTTMKKWSALARSQRPTLRQHFQTIFGVSHGMLQRFIRRAEYNCLRFALSMFESASDSRVRKLASRFNDAILIQNMDSLFRQLPSLSAKTRDILTATVVSYISLIEAIGIIHSETDVLLANWDSDYIKRGIRPKSIYGCVEILSKDQKLRRLYFPVPSFIDVYWSYPEIQKVKDRIVMEVNRSSPEEKISDFFTQINRISLVMKRQERLRMLLTPAVHSIFGGKSFTFMSYLPDQRVILLLLTIALNCYFVYYSTAPKHLPSRNEYLETYLWDTRDLALYIVQWCHFGISALIFVRTLLNSDAADNIEPLFTFTGPFTRIISSTVHTIYKTILIFWSALWVGALTVSSFFALRELPWLYVPCLIDVVFLVDAMHFLYLAISRNVVRVGFTLILAFLCLYFYAIAAYLFIGNQYNLNEKSDCKDPGACFKLHLDYGLYNSPTWESEGYIQPDLGLTFPYSHIVEYAIGTMYNLTYVILINLVLQAIVSGLIIDSFQSMREEKEQIVADIEDKCFTCSIPRDAFEQTGISFPTHISEEHNMWHYVWFKTYLDLKDPLGFSSIENHAYRAFNDQKLFIRMMPIKQSLTVTNAAADSGDFEAQNSEMEHIRSTLSKLQTTQNSLARTLQTVTDGQRDLDDSFSSISSQLDNIMTTVTTAAKTSSITKVSRHP